MLVPVNYPTRAKSITDAPPQQVSALITITADASLKHVFKLNTRL
jgi:hypothetical protein